MSLSRHIMLSQWLRRNRLKFKIQGKQTVNFARSWLTLATAATSLLGFADPVAWRRIRVSGRASRTGPTPSATVATYYPPVRPDPWFGLRRPDGYLSFHRDH